MTPIWSEKSGFCEEDGVYYSTCPPAVIPQDDYSNWVSYTLARDWGDEKALIDAATGAVITHRELRQKVGAVASGLAVMGVKQGDVVMIAAPNSVHVPVCMLAIGKVGCVVTCANIGHTASEIRGQVQDSGAEYVVTILSQVEKFGGLDVQLIVIDGESEGGGSKVSGGNVPHLYSELIRADPSMCPEVQSKPGDTALILYSSGTTGKSKGVMLSHKNLIAAMAILENCRHYGGFHVVCISVVPLFHVMGIVHNFLSQISRGHTVVVMEKFDFVLMLKAIQRYRVTNVSIVPPIMLDLAKQDIVLKFDLSSIRYLGTGAAPAGKSVMDTCAARCPNAIVTQGYGLTESTGVGTVVPSYLVSPSTASCGRLASNLEAKIVDVETGKSLPPMKNGELRLRGPAVMEGYLNNEEATREVIDKEGWMRTGDVCHFDENGWMYVVTRIKEIIKYNGYQVAPTELEALLITHPEIADAAVVPFPDDRTGEIPFAFVVRSKGSSISEAHVMEFVAKQVASYKKVRKVNFISSIPKSQAGKILRRELIAMPRSKL